MKILKAVALFAVGISLVSSGWCGSPTEIEATCERESNQGPCHQGVKTRGKCNWSNSKCRAKCDQFANKASCEELKIGGKNHCKWVSAGSQGLCRPN